MFGHDAEREERALHVEVAREIEIYEAIRIAQTHAVELVELGLAAETPGELHDALREHFGVTEAQAEVMAELQVRNLTKSIRTGTVERIAELETLADD